MRFLFPLVLLLGIVSPLRAETPNVVLILSDDQAWTDYGFMGHEAIETPSLDALARQSLVFTRGYVPSSLCRPSLVSIISGLYPHQHKITGNDQRAEGDTKPPRENVIRFIDEVPTLPRLLADQGYVSYQAGKWWEGHYRRGGFTDGMTHGKVSKGGRHGDEGLAIGREGMQPVFDFLDQARAKEKPFLLWYAPFLPHEPHNPPQRLLDKYQQRTRSLHVAKYWAMCEWFDETCGQLLDYLDQHSLAENTIVIYVTDNGWIQNPSGRGYAPRSKRSVYDGGLRTPILVRWPSKVQPQTVGTPVSSIDIAPTVLKACGLKPTEAMSGVNLLDDEAVQSRTAIFGEVYTHDVPEPGNPAAGLLYRWCIEFPHKLVEPHDANEAAELYNLKTDPFERENLAAEKPERVEQLRALLNEWWNPDSPSAATN